MQQSDHPVIIVMNDRRKRQMIREALTRRGYTKFRFLMSGREAIPAMKANPGAMMHIEWQGQDTLELLEKDRLDKKGISRAIFIYAVHHEPNLLAGLTDYVIERVHYGSVKEAQVLEALDHSLSPQKSHSMFKGCVFDIQNAQKEGDAHKFTTLVTDALDKFPGNLRFRCELAAVYIDRLELNVADELLDEEEMGVESIPRFLHLKARVALMKREHKKAEELLAQSLLLNPKNVDRLVDFGEILLQQLRAKDAEARFDQALAIEPSYTPANLGKARAKLLDEQLEEGIQLIKGFSSEADRASIFNNAGVINVRHHRFKQAIKLYELAEGLLGSPSLRARVVFNKGLTMVRLSRFEDGIQLMSRACELDGEFEKAAHWLEKLKPRDPDLDDLDDLDFIDNDDFLLEEAIGGESMSFAEEIVEIE